MKLGAFLHQHVLINPLLESFQNQGATVHREYPATNGKYIGSVDIWVEHAQIRIAIEAELTPKRIQADIKKALALRADELWIVVPTQRVVRAIRRKLAKISIATSGLDLFVLTQGQALSRVTNCLSLFAGS